MATSMWRMNGLCRRTAGVLLLCALLLSGEVMCQDDTPTDATHATDAPGVSPDAATAPDAPDAGATPAAAAGGQSAASSAAPGVNDFPSTIVNLVVDPNILDGGTSGTTAAPVGSGDGDDVTVAATAPVVKAVVPEVQCVGKEDMPESVAVKVQVVTDDCEVTKRIIQKNPAGWCNKENCNLEIFQEGNTMWMGSGDAQLGTLAQALQSEQLKEQLGVTKIELPSSAGSSVFVGILVTGLLAAIAITVGYVKCQRRPDTKGVRLAEEAYPVDQENQGNTLVSVAPLTPPPETPEKPSVNGEAPEADKTQPPPPTNGHSTAKTADTEL
ncbi:LOW QUALITY PROTEIN: uncharacterized protein cd34 [Embiotoca jacksoni]|uniref:LOW QUALITY PROTEIN: uncharacterized protein cd34 n=1 Tax=Embiotoca jacksoni TaxID=100190 RepID=UPI0037038431